MRILAEKLIDFMKSLFANTLKWSSDIFSYLNNYVLSWFLMNKFYSEYYYTVLPVHVEQYVWNSVLFLVFCIMNQLNILKILFSDSHRAIEFKEKNKIRMLQIDKLTVLLECKKQLIKDIMSTMIII